jgi:hypothetical protein
MSAMTQACEYEKCKCVVRGDVQGAAYCSEVCAARDGSDEEFEVNCECGHSPCDAE